MITAASESLIEGLTVRLVEDDYYFAHETRCALQNTEARMLGARSGFHPRPHADRHGAKVLLVSSYDDQVIPADLAGAPLVHP